MAHELSVYFDGGCPLCSREIDHYRRKDAAGHIRFVDIDAPGFDAAGEGLDPDRVQRLMHARLASGEIVSGVAAFAAIWDTLPGHTWMARLARRPGVRTAAALGYAAFARIRPLLPRRRAGCDDGACAVPPSQRARRPDARA